MKKERKYDDDDGRTIADMSDVDPMPLLLPRFRRNKEDRAAQNEMSKEDRRAFLFGTIGAVLLIGGVFIAAGAIVIFILTKVLS